MEDIIQLKKDYYGVDTLIVPPPISSQLLSFSYEGKWGPVKTPYIQIRLAGIETGHGDIIIIRKRDKDAYTKTGFYRIEDTFTPTLQIMKAVLLQQGFTQEEVNEYDCNCKCEYSDLWHAIKNVLNSL